jgi:hypothetical protein
MVLGQRGHAESKTFVLQFKEHKTCCLSGLFERICATMRQSKLRFSTRFSVAASNCSNWKKPSWPRSVSGLVVKDSSRDLEEAIAFFQQVKQRPETKKGILRIRL